jgi:hypothetical protein
MYKIQFSKTMVGQIKASVLIYLWTLTLRRPNAIMDEEAGRGTQVQENQGESIY